MSSNSNSPPNLLVVDNSFVPYKPKKPHPYHKYTNNYILAFLFSSLLFLFLFKNLSFPSLFNSTIFWFFISNTLIFIIAADYYYALFSLSQHKSFDFYEDFYSPPNPKQTPFQLQSSSLVVFDEERENPDEKLKVVARGRDFQPPLKPSAIISYPRSKSEKPKRSVIKESKKMMGRRSESVEYEAKEIEENEFSKMTDEELNNRVEEFIQRFNRQMRLQKK